MSLIDVRCLSCETVSEVYRSKDDWPKTPPCEKCSGDTEQIHLPKSVRSYAPAVVVFQAPDGSFRYPGSADGLSAHSYEKMGYTRVEAQGWAAVRSLEKKLNSHERSVMERSIERKQALHEAAVKMRRSEVYAGLAGSFVVPEIDPVTKKATGRMKSCKLSPIGRDVMRAAMERNDAKPGPRMRDPNTFVEVYSQDRSNREESRDAQGRRRHD